MAECNHYDVIIVGSGAGGGTLARKLASTGKKILILERGGYVPREKDNWNPRAVNSKESTKPKRSGTTKTAMSCTRTPIITSAGIRNFLAPRCFV